MSITTTHFVVELKCSSKGTAKTGKWSHPGRVWVRGYKDGVRVYQEHIAFVDMRYSGFRSGCGQAMLRATRRVQELNMTTQN